MTDRMRLLLVTVGLVSAQLLMSLRPAGDVNGEVALVPDGMLWLGGMALASGLSACGMLYGRKEGGWLPLLFGILGAGLILLLANVEYGISPNWAAVGFTTLIWGLLSLRKFAAGWPDR